MTNASVAPQDLSLTGATTRGTAWMIAQSLAGKAVNTGGQIVLTWLLAPEYWGLIALTYILVMFGEELRAMGVLQVLVHRHKRYRRWANAAFWMSAAVGLAAGLLMVAAAKPMAIICGEPELVGLIAVLSLRLPIHALATVPEARLQIQMRFGTLAAATFAQTVGIVGLAIIFAWLGFGAYSFAWPHVIVHLGRTIAFWWLAAPPLRGRFQFRRWKYLIGDSLRVFWAKILEQVSWQAPYFVLGIFHSSDVVGLFYVAVAFSAQTLRMITLHLALVLFPALAKLQDEAGRQVKAFLRACRLLAIVTIPLCMLQAALARPLVELLLEAKFQPVAPLIEILSLGAAVRAVSAPSMSMIQAQGRFGLLLLLNLLYAVLILITATGCTWVGGSILGYGENQVLVLLAAGAAVCYAILAPIQSYLAVHRGGGRWRDVATIYAAPILVGLIASGLGVVLSRLVPAMPLRQLVQVAIITVTFGGICLLVFPLICPADTHDLWQRLKGLIPQRLRLAGRAAEIP
jgi:PST family polysaccharide transporter